MVVKFNKFEKVAGLFVLGIIMASIAFGFIFAVKKGWFSSTVSYYIFLESADGVHEGTEVQIAGLKVGNVKHVELISDSKIKVDFTVFKKFQERVREDSLASMFRPFIIGEKIIDVSIGNQDLGILKSGNKIKYKESYDLMDLASGRKLGPFVQTVSKLTENFKVLLEAFTERKRTDALVRIFDNMEPLVKNLNLMSINMNRVAHSLNKKKRFEHLITNMDSLVVEFAKITPAINAIAPELPEASLRAVQALNEAVILLRAMQKNFLMTSNVKEVKLQFEKDKAEIKKKLKERLPASK